MQLFFRCAYQTHRERFFAILRKGYEILYCNRSCKCRACAYARKAAEVLRRNGHEQTYDWTTHGDIRHEGAERMSEVAFNELRAVRDAELVVALLPGGQGTHTELGVALATRSNKRIILWSETGDEFAFDNRTCTFYFHPAAERVVCPFEELLEILNTDRIDSASNFAD